LQICLQSQYACGIIPLVVVALVADEATGE
jgi:hypothetical protein